MKRKFGQMDNFPQSRLSYYRRKVFKNDFQKPSMWHSMQIVFLIDQKENQYNIFLFDNLLDNQIIIYQDEFSFDFASKSSKNWVFKEEIITFQNKNHKKLFNSQYKLLWNKTYPSQAICLYWDSYSSILLLGLDEGKISALEILPENGFTKFDEIGDPKFEHHQASVMGVFYDSLTNTIHSVSEDKKYKVHDLQRQMVLSDIQPSNHPLTCLQGDREGRRVFMADRGCSIHIYELISSSQCTRHSASVSTQTSSVIRGLAYDPIKNYLFSAGYDSGEQESLMLESQVEKNLQNKLIVQQGKIKEVVWSNQRGECFVGNKDGTVTIWSAKKGAPIYVIKAHSNDITKLTWFDDQMMLVTSSKEKSIKLLQFWQLPKEWRDKKIEAQEEREWEQQKKQENILQSQAAMKKREFDSDEDDLAGWHK